ncbi:hypothetical protein MMC34_006682 [Xylographa carneopallida]|nr:hypothetical protein [Xylographa carneopallida]
MQEILQKEFEPKAPKGSHDCNQDDNAAADAIEARTMILGDLPTTLAVIPENSYRNIEGATADDISFTYLSDLGERRVTYRWPGGAYQNHGNFHVYWTDDDFSSARGQLRIYDPLQANGIIIGEVPPDHYVNKIVDYWANGCAMLFYQRVSIEPMDSALSESRMGQKRKRTKPGLETPEKTPQRMQPRAPGEVIDFTEC